MKDQQKETQFPVTIFYAYAQADESLCKKLEKHLSGLRRERLITEWYDRQIVAGADWRREIDTQINRASIILLLVSPDFLASEYCSSIEMQRALERHEAKEASVIPILLRPADWQGTPLSKLQMLPTRAKPITSWRNRDEAFADVTRGIRKVVEDLKSNSFTASPSSFPPIWHVPYPRNPFFTGREDLLAKLAQELKDDAAAGVVPPHAICGLSGVGKTQVVVEYAYRSRHNYQTVLWAWADTREALVSSYVTIARSLNLPEKDEQDQMIIISAVMQWLKTQARWLMILDNADNLLLVKDFIPPAFGGHLLLTTRAQSMGKLAKRIEMETMTPEVGALFLLRRSTLLALDAPLEQASESNRGIALKIARELGSLPLALDQAGAYLEEAACSLTDYLQLYRSQRLTLLKRRGGLVADHPQPVATTWSLSFEQIEQLNPAAADLLRMCAFLHPDAIPVEIINEGGSHLGPHLQRLATDTLALNEAIIALRAYSLLNRDALSETVSIHRLIQTVLKDEMSKEAYQGWAMRVVRAVDATFPDEVMAMSSQCQRLLPHVQVCADLIEEVGMLFPEAAHLLNQAGAYIYKRGLYDDAESLLVPALAMRERVLGDKHLDTLISLNYLALLYQAQGKYNLAEPFLQHALPLCEQVMGAVHPDTASTANNLALVYQAQGKYPQAESLFLHALSIREQALGATHPNTAQSLSNLAGLYDAQGRYEEAEPLHWRSLTIREQILDSMHPDIVQSLNNLAASYSYQGKYDQAEPLLQRALTISEHQLGPMHPSVATNLNNLGVLYRRQNKLEQAEPLLQRALNIREKVLEASHPDLIATLNNLAALAYSQKQYEEAEKRLQHALAISEQALGSTHPVSAAILNNLGKIYETQGKLEQASLFMSRALVAREQMLGTPHPDTQETLRNYVRILRAMQRADEAAQFEARIIR